MLWFRMFPSARQEARDTAASEERQIRALETHHQRVLDALERELALYQHHPVKDHRQ